MCDFVEDCEYWGYDDVQLVNKSDGIFGCFLARKKIKRRFKLKLRDLFTKLLIKNF